MIDKRFEVTIDGAKLVGTRMGNGPALVFLHAGVADQRMWQPQVDAFGDAYTVVTYDRRGFGETTSPNEPFSHVEDLRHILTHLEIESATLLGCSQGGRVAIDFALAFPEKVTALALLAPAVSGQPGPGGFPPQIQILMDALDEADEADDLARINEIEAHMWLDGPTSKEGRVGGELRKLFLDMNGIALQMPELEQEIEPSSAYERVSQLSQPTVVLWGSLDFPHVRERCQRLLNEIPNSSGQEIEAAAHLASLEKSEAVDEVLKVFFEPLWQS